VCHQYWPTTGIREFGEYTVDLLGEEELEGFVLRTLSVLESRVYTRPLSCSYSCFPLVMRYEVCMHMNVTC